MSQAGGPYYQVKKGRWDGRILTAINVSANIPKPNSTIDRLVTLFESKGLMIDDMVTLSGGHTVGFAHSEHFLGRPYNYSGTGWPDLYIEPRLLKSLRMSCPEHGGNPDIVAPVDLTKAFLFDHAYYGNLEARLGLLRSDVALFVDPSTRPIVSQLGMDKGKFFQMFGAALEKMGSIGEGRGEAWREEESLKTA